MKSENHTETACFFYVGKWKKVFPAASRVSLTVGEIWECGKGVEMGVGNLENAEINAFSAVFKKVWECGNNFQETENFMEFQNVFQEMLNVTAAPPAPPEATPPEKEKNPSVSAMHCQLPYRGAYSGKERTACAAALQRAGIPTDAPYYAGAFQVVERAVKAAKKAARRPEQNEYQKDCPDTTAAARHFWQAYLLSLCGHLERLEREAEPEDKPQERQLLRGGIRTVQAVLYALQETERTENEPRETA